MNEAKREWASAVQHKDGWYIYFGEKSIGPMDAANASNGAYNLNTAFTSVAVPRELALHLATWRDCPHCPNQGWYQTGNPETGEPEQTQCEFCYSENSQFKARVAWEAFAGKECK